MKKVFSYADAILYFNSYFSILNSFSGKSCPPDWILFNNYCYLLKNHLLTWDQALSYCNGLGAALVKIRGAEENDFVLDLSKQNTTVDKVWIGLKWYTGDDYYWYDSSVPGYTNWVPGQPNGGANEPCRSMYTAQRKENLPLTAAGYWNDVKCAGVPKIGIVCKRLP